MAKEQHMRRKNVGRMPRSGKFNTDLTKSQKIPSTVEHIEMKSQKDHPKDVRLFRSASDSYYFLFLKVFTKIGDNLKNQSWAQSTPLHF